MTYNKNLSNSVSFNYKHYDLKNHGVCFDELYSETKQMAIKLILLTSLG